MCNYKGQNYSEGSILKFDDGKLYQCYSGEWRLWSNFNVIINSAYDRIENSDEITDFAIYQKDNNSFQIEFIKIGEMFDVNGFDDIRQMNIELSDGKINIIIHYNNQINYENFNSVVTSTTRIYGNSVKQKLNNNDSYVTFYLKNIGSYNNNYVVWDRRNGNQIFNGAISAWNQVAITTSASSSGYGDISYSKNGNSPYGVPWIKNNDIVNT